MGQTLRLVDLRRKTFDAQLVNSLVPRAEVDIEAAMAVILPIIAEVSKSSLAAVTRITLDRDGFDPQPLWVSDEEFDRAEKALEPALRESIETAISRVSKVSQANLPHSTSVSLDDGAEVSQRWVPVDSVGLYVPGGKAVYPSSVVMNVVPAQVAGVKEMVIATPGQADFGGRPHPTVLATAALLGVRRVLNLGGPAAIAAFAFGIQEIGLDPVAMVTGPGNIYVAAAKRALRGRIGIDSEAGTTEILVIADESANARFVAADLISQAEHDESAASILVTDSEKLAEMVQRELELQLAKTSNRVRAGAALAGQQSAIVLVDDLQAAVLFANCYATEHLELQTKVNQQLLKSISNAGAVFIGGFSPVSLGDYLAGSNHVLPTGQQAKFGSGLGVHTFLRAQQVVNYSETALKQVAALVDGFARSEGLSAHGDAVKVRFEI
ncbi:MAG: histidinol dehydrogenase [Actinomycetes bacterium]